MIHIINKLVLQHYIHIHIIPIINVHIKSRTVTSRLGWYLIIKIQHQMHITDMPGGSAEIVRLTPVNMVCHYTYEVNGLRGLDRVADLRAALSGMSGSLNMSGDSLPAGLSESLLFDGMVSRNQIIGGFYTFGHSALEGEPNVFRLYLKNRSGSMSVLEQDVSDQVHDVPVAGHVGDVHLVLNFDYEVPSEPGSDGAGRGSPRFRRIT